MKTNYVKILNRMNKIINRVNARRQPDSRSRCKGLKVKWRRTWKMLKYNCFSLCGMVVLTMALASCDGHHEFPDTSMKVGHVLCTDGRVMALEECDRQNKVPIAVVFHLNNDEKTEGNGYAVYIRDLPDEALPDSVGVAQGTSADLYAQDGNTNTFKMYANSGCGSPAANAVFSMWRYGQSAYIPSVAQMRLLYVAKPYINHVIEKCGGDPLPDEADEVWYWTSTEVAGQETSKAWLYSLGSGAMQETPKLQLHKIRPIVTLNE